MFFILYKENVLHFYQKNNPNTVFWSVYDLFQDYEKWPMYTAPT